MSARVDQATWDKLVEAYRDDPGNHSAAARHAVVQRKTAKRAYLQGYPTKPWGKKPIQQLLDEEVELARSRQQLEEERAELQVDQAQLEADRDREAARQAAVKTKQQEIVLVAGARAAAMNAIAASIKGLPGIASALERLGQELTTMALGGPVTPKELGAISSMGRRYASMLRDLVSAGQMAMEMERLRVGDPTQIIGVETDLDQMPVEDLVRMAGYQDGVLQRAAARGLIVLPGGKTGS